MLQISGLYIYPIKSFPGISLPQAKVTERGLAHDRRWMLVDENNLFISQREAPQMTQLPLSLKKDGLKVTNKITGDSIIIPYEPPAGGRQADVVIWDDTCVAEYVGDSFDQWFSKNLGVKCRLVFMPGYSRRIVDQRYAPGDSITSFSDAYPFLIIGQSSLDELNSRLLEPLPMNRFRPNIVFTGGLPFEEDLMKDFTIAGIKFSGVKLCARCVMTTINQDSAARGKEPLKTLAKYRQKDNKILFGQNLVHQGDGVISIGDTIETQSVNTDERFLVNIEPEKI